MLDLSCMLMFSGIPIVFYCICPPCGQESGCLLLSLEWPGQHGHRLLTENLMVVTAKLILLEAILGCRGFTGGRNNELYKDMASKKKRITVVLQNCSKGLES